MPLVAFSCGALAAAFALAVSGCGGDDTAAAPAQHAYSNQARGLTVVLPSGWQAASRSLTPALRDPREVVTAATFPLRYRETGCAQFPSSALEDLGPRDALVTVQERGRSKGAGWSGFPPRPEHFGPELGGPSEASACVRHARFSDHWFPFSDRGRHFHVEVAFGSEAPADVREQAWAVLDSLRVDPHVRPDWSATD